MDTLESAVSMMKELSETDLRLTKEFMERLSRKDIIREEMYNPYKPLTREEIIEQLSVAKKHADNGMFMDAHKISDNIREKYCL